jgi:type I restriction-modification system DNA methylase subunit
MSLSKGKEANSKVLAELEDLQKKIPTQSWQSREQIQLQQFSTSPSIGFLMTKILNLSRTELILEPSAGTGSLAAWLTQRFIDERSQPVPRF